MASQNLDGTMSSFDSTNQPCFSSKQGGSTIMLPTIGHDDSTTQPLSPRKKESTFITPRRTPSRKAKESILPGDYCDTPSRSAGRKARRAKAVGPPESETPALPSIVSAQGKGGLPLPLESQSCGWTTPLRKEGISSKRKGILIKKAQRVQRTAVTVESPDDSGPATQILPIPTSPIAAPSQPAVAIDTLAHGITKSADKDDNDPFLVSKGNACRCSEIYSPVIGENERLRSELEHLRESHTAHQEQVRTAFGHVHDHMQRERAEWTSKVDLLERRVVSLEQEAERRQAILEHGILQDLNKQRKDEGGNEKGRRLLERMRGHQAKADERVREFRMHHGA